MIAAEKEKVFQLAVELQSKFKRHAPNLLDVLNSARLLSKDAGFLLLLHVSFMLFHGDLDKTESAEALEPLDCQVFC